LLRDRFGLGLFSLFLLARGFLCCGNGLRLHAFGFGLSLLRFGASLLRLLTSRFGLRSSLFGIRAASGFSVRIRARFRFTSRSGGLGFVFRLLLHGHQPRFFRSLGGFLGGGRDRRFILLLAIDLFRMQ